MYFCFIEYTKAFDFVDHNSGKFLKGWEYQTPFSASWEINPYVGQEETELDMEQQTGSK